jgi:hypothetical protein
VSERRRLFSRRAETTETAEDEPSAVPEATAPSVFGDLASPNSPEPDEDAGPDRSDPPESAALRRATELRRSMSLAAERIDQIVSDAYELAEEIRREAEAEADRYLKARRLDADLIVQEQLSDVRKLFAELRAGLDELEDQALSQLDPSDETPARPPVLSRPSERPVPRQTAYPGTSAASAAAPRRPADRNGERAAALIKASRLAIGGQSRDQIVAALQADFDLDRLDEIVDELLPQARAEPQGSQGR